MDVVWLLIKKRGMSDCAFCRTCFPDNDADALAMVQSRVAKKDPAATLHLGQTYYHGGLGLQKDMRKAIKLKEEAAELGSVDALFSLAIAYRLGNGVEADRAKADQFYKKAAMQGHVQSRHNLGCYEGEKGNHYRASRHFLISAKMGHGGSLELVKKLFMGGLVTKEQYADALKGYQDAAEELKSHDRDEAKRLGYLP